MEILTLVTCLRPVLSRRSVRHLSRLAQALLTMTGRVTMTGLARWIGPGGSYRTVQRFFATALPWPQVFWAFFRHHRFQPDEVYILAGAEGVVTKAGKKTHGLDRFFSGVLQKVVPSVAFFSLALVSTTSRRAFPLRVDQVVRAPAEKAASRAAAAQKPTPPRRPAPSARGAGPRAVGINPNRR